VFRSVTSKVSALSGFVAKGHQTLQCISPSPSSNRTCGFPASGFPLDFVKRHTLIKLRLPIKLLSQNGEFYGNAAPSDVNSRHPIFPLFHRGTYVQVALHSSHSACPRQGPLAPRALPRFFATMGLSDSRLQQTSRLFIPGYPPALTPDHSGSPRFLGASFRARSPLSPRDALQMHLPVASLQISDFVVSGRLVASIWCNEAEPGSLALGLTRLRSVVSLHFALNNVIGYRPASHARLPSHRGPPLHSEQAITMAGTSQPARCTRLSLAHRIIRIPLQVAYRLNVFKLPF
jgi:hypothetical protein